MAVYQLLANTITFFTFNTVELTLSMDERGLDLSEFQVQGSELSLAAGYSHELDLQYVAMVTLRGIYKFDYDPFTQE